MTEATEKAIPPEPTDELRTMAGSPQAAGRLLTLLPFRGRTSGAGRAPRRTRHRDEERSRKPRHAPSGAMRRWSSS
jgi:hypothetical protein